MTRILLFSLVLILVGGCAQVPMEAQGAAEDELSRQQEGFLDALVAQNLEDIADYFTEDAVLHIANMPPVEGRQAIIRFYGNLFSFLESSQAQSETLRLSEGGSMAYTMGSVTNRFHGEAGVIEYAGKFLLIWEHHDEAWRVAVYSVSSNQR